MQWFKNKQEFNRRAEDLNPKEPMVRLFNNITDIVKDDLEVTIKKDSKISIAASCFSIYAFEALKEQLTNIEELRFIFTSPTFTTEKTAKSKREFYIPRLQREKNLYGSEFEIKLRNELTQKAIAKECAEWIKNKVKFKSNVSNQSMDGFMNVENLSNAYTYMPMNGFTTVDIGCEKGNNAYSMVTRMASPASSEFLQVFDSIWNDKEKLQDVTQEVIDNITTVYKENPPEYIYFVTLYNIFNEFLEDISDDVLPNEAVGFKESVIWNKLYSFQKDAVLGIINKLEKYNGCILADSVGLGKTFTALAVIKYYESRNKTVLVLCPKKLTDNWNTYNNHYINNPLEADRFSYDVFYHTDLSRDRGFSNGKDLMKINWRNYDLVVIDESHNFRNGGNIYADEKQNRYVKLVTKVIKPGVKTKVLMLSATPVNNRFNDLKNQLALAYVGRKQEFTDALGLEKNVDEIFKKAQTAFNEWEKLPVDERTTQNLLRSLDFDFFELLDSVTIARSRKHIEKYYNMQEIGNFPERLKPKAIRAPLTKMPDAITFNEIYMRLSQLNLSIYSPMNFVLSSKKEYYAELYDTNVNFTQTDREKALLILMRINLLKRLESSVYSFRLTIKRIIELISSTLENIKNHNVGELELEDFSEVDSDEDEDTLIGKKVKIKLDDMDYISWGRDLEKDLEVLSGLMEELEKITPDVDEKLLELFNVIREKQKNPINPGNKKILIFSAFAETVDYLFDNVSNMVKTEFGLETAKVTGGEFNKSTLKIKNNDVNTILTLFSPNSKEKHILMPGENGEIDILIATDCISEGQNLQDCDYQINYDIHWNPVRIVQRFGRVDRIGSKNKYIQMVSFWPDITLDEYINLKSRVENRMKISNLTATGDDNPIDFNDTEAEYRKRQLEKLQNEVVDLEEISGGISIMDLGLNDFRMDLLSYIKDNPDIDKAPFGLHAVVKGEEPGVIFILKNVNEKINIESKNRLHPFYMVYIGDNGQVISNHLEPKQTLDILRHLTKGKNAPDMELCKLFNLETYDGKKMDRVSGLLEEAIASIVSINEEVDIDSFFGTGNTTNSDIAGLNDFELICFIVVKG